MASSVEVDERFQSDLGRDVALGLGGLQLLDCSVVGVDVGSVVFVVVEFHYLAGDGGFEGAIIVF